MDRAVGEPDKVSNAVRPPGTEVCGPPSRAEAATGSCISTPSYRLRNRRLVPPGQGQSGGWKCSSMNGPLRIAARDITGAFSTVSLDTLSVETNLLPTNLRLELRIYNSIAAITTLPTSHPIHQTFDKAGDAS